MHAFLTPNCERASTEPGAHEKTRSTLKGCGCFLFPCPPTKQVARRLLNDDLPLWGKPLDCPLPQRVNPAARQRTRTAPKERSWRPTRVRRARVKQKDARRVNRLAGSCCPQLLLGPTASTPGTRPTQKATAGFLVALVVLVSQVTFSCWFGDLNPCFL